MAYDFNGSSDGIRINKSADWDFVDTDWCYVFWANSDSMGSTTRAIHEFLGADGGSVLIWLHDTLIQISVKVTSGGTTILAVDSSTSRPAGWACYIMGRTGNDLVLYENNNLLDTDDGTGDWGAEAVSASAPSLGASLTLSGRFYDGRLAEFHKFNGWFPDAGQRAALQKMFRPYMINPSACAIDIPLLRQESEQISGLSSFIVVAGYTVVDHPSIIYPTPVYVPFGPSLLQELTIPDITTDESIGTHQLDLNLVLSALSSDESIGSHTLLPQSVTITPNVLTSDESIGSHILDLVLTLTAVATDEAIGGHTLTPGAVTLTLSPIASDESIGSHQVDFTLTLVALGSDESIGDHTIVAETTQVVELAALASDESIGSHTLDPQAVTITLTPLTSDESIGSHSIKGQYLITTTKIATAEDIGDHQLNLSLLLSHLASGESIGSHTVTPGVVTVTVPPISSDESIGSHTLENLTQYILPALIVSDEDIKELVVFVPGGAETIGLLIRGVGQ